MIAFTRIFSAMVSTQLQDQIVCSPLLALIITVLLLVAFT